MADYRSGLIIPSSGDQCIQLFAVLRASLAASGWTEYDVISDTPTSKNVVFRGAELNSGAGNRPYVQLTATPTTMASKVFSFWNNSSHVGFGQCGGGLANTVLTSRTYYWVRSNSVSITWCIYPITQGYHWKFYCGFLRRGLPTIRSGVTQTTSSAFYGDTVLNVATDMTGKLQVGQRVMILDNSAASFYGESQVIQSISPTSITFEAGMGFTHAANALIGYNPQPLVYLESGGTTAAEFFSSVPSYASFTMDGYYWGPTALQAYQENIFFGTESNSDPCDYSSFHNSGIINILVTAAVDTRSYRAGIPYHWELMSSELLRKADIASNGANNYVMLGCSPAGAGAMVLGPV